MRKILAAAALLAAPAALAVELSYTWKKGDVHRFSHEDKTEFEVKMNAMPGMGGMMGGPGGGPTVLEVRSVFSQKVLAVRADGTAEIELTVEKLDVFQGGMQMASLSQIPPAARVARAEVDRKGRAKFFRTVTVYMKDDTVFLAVNKVESRPGHASVSASAGGKNVELVASVDPRTGRVTASAKVTEAPPPALKKVQVKEEDPHVDVMPKQIFEMMVLPEGSLAVGGEAGVETPFGKIVTRLDEQKGDEVRLNVRMAADAGKANKAVAAAAEEEQAEPGAEPAGMGMGGGGMPDMGAMMGGGGMPGMGGPPVPPGKKAKSGAEEMPGMKMDLDVACRFDLAKGRLLGLAGTVATDMEMAGMASMKTRSKFKLTRL